MVRVRVKRTTYTRVTAPGVAPHVPRPRSI